MVLWVRPGRTHTPSSRHAPPTAPPQQAQCECVSRVSLLVALLALEAPSCTGGCPVPPRANGGANGVPWRCRRVAACTMIASRPTVRGGCQRSHRRARPERCDCSAPGGGVAIARRSPSATRITPASYGVMVWSCCSGRAKGRPPANDGRRREGRAPRRTTRRHPLWRLRRPVVAPNKKKRERPPPKRDAKKKEQGTDSWRTPRPTRRGETGRARPLVHAPQADDDPRVARGDRGEHAANDAQVGEAERREHAERGEHLRYR